MKIKKWKQQVHILTYMQIAPEEQKQKYELIVVTPTDFESFTDMLVEKFGSITVNITVEANEE